MILVIGESGEYEQRHQEVFGIFRTMDLAERENRGRYLRSRNGILPLCCRGYWALCSRVSPRKLTGGGPMDRSSVISSQRGGTLSVRHCER